MQHSHFVPDCKPASDLRDPLTPWPPTRWYYLSIRSLELAQDRIATALPLDRPAPCDLVKAELLEQAADLVDVAKFAGEVSLILQGPMRPLLLASYDGVDLMVGGIVSVNCGPRWLLSVVVALDELGPTIADPQGVFPPYRYLWRDRGLYWIVVAGKAVRS